jgi:hypothetical protein
VGWLRWDALTTRWHSRRVVVASHDPILSGLFNLSMFCTRRNHVAWATSAPSDGVNLYPLVIDPIMPLYRRTNSLQAQLAPSAAAATTPHISRAPGFV